MRTRSLVGLIGLLAVGGGLVAQQPPPEQKTEGTRDLYYFGATQKDTLPPIRKVSTAARAKSTAAPTLSAGTAAEPDPATAHAAADHESFDGARSEVHRGADIIGGNRDGPGPGDAWRV